MSDSLINLIIALSGALLGGGGYAAYIRASGQNRVDMYQASIQRIARLEERTDHQDKRNDALAEQNARLQGTVNTFEAERQGWNERLKVQRVLIDDLNLRIGRLDVTEEENVRLRQQLQVEVAKVEFLQREVRELREEVARLLRQIDELREKQEAHGF